MKSKQNTLHSFFVRNPMVAFILSFVVLILLGTLLLMLPLSNRNGQWLDPVSAFFTATSATCVTGLTVGDPHTMFTLFGQIVIILLIQVGGLSFMSLAAIFMMIFRKAISFGERMMVSSALGLSTGGGALALVRLAVKGTLLIEGSGALLLSLYFIPRHGLLPGLWKAVFLAISAFCNAGFDILGNGNSLTALQNNGYVLTVLMALTVIGGLGFLVWQDLITKGRPKDWSIYTKMVLTMTGALLLFGTLFYLLTEWNNPHTLGSMPIGTKLLNALFCSVTMRTVGFATFDMAGLAESSKAISCLLMLIGGSSGSTAGGIKTVTFFVVLITALQVAAGRHKIQYKHRTIGQDDVHRAFSLFFIAGILVTVSTVVLSFAEPNTPLIDLLFTGVSGIATVGVASCNVAAMSAFSKILLAALMFTGRVGILSITLSIMVRLNRAKDKISYPKANIMIG